MNDEQTHDGETMDTIKIDPEALKEAAHLAGHEGVSLRMSSMTRGLITRHIVDGDMSERMDEFEAEAGPLRMVFGADIVLDEVMRYGWVGIALRDGVETRCIVADGAVEDPETMDTIKIDPEALKEAAHLAGHEGVSLRMSRETFRVFGIWADKMHTPLDPEEYQSCTEPECDDQIGQAYGSPIRINDRIPFGFAGISRRGSMETRCIVADEPDEAPGGNAPSEDAEPFDLSTLEGRVVVNHLRSDYLVRVSFEDGAMLILSCEDATPDVSGWNSDYMTVRSARKEHWWNKLSITLGGESAALMIRFLSDDNESPQVSYELREPRTETEQRARRVAKQWAAAMEDHYMEMNWKALGLLMPPSIVDQMNDVLECTDVRQFVREQAEKLDREMMSDLDDDTRTLPAPWRDPAEEWPEEGMDILVAVREEAKDPHVFNHIVRGSVEPSRRIYTDSRTPTFFKPGEIVANNGKVHFIAWMPIPSHPLDNDDTAS